MSDARCGEVICIEVIAVRRELAYEAKIALVRHVDALRNGMTVIAEYRSAELCGGAGYERADGVLGRHRPEHRRGPVFRASGNAISSAGE